MIISKVIRAGIHTSIQDLGRPGFRHQGVPDSGALDAHAHIQANITIGNSIHSPTLEITGPGLSLEMLNYAKIAIAGADLGASLNGVPMKKMEIIHVGKNDVLTFGQRSDGYRSYLAIQGGWEGQKKLGSYSTHPGTRWGGFEGRVLEKDDLLSCNKTFTKRKFATDPLDIHFSQSDPIRIFPTQETSLIDPQVLIQHRWSISPQSNRTGFGLEGPLIHLKVHEEMISAPVDVGTVQLPPSGKPIILMNDGASIGGYPRIAQVCQADLPLLAQKHPLESFHFEWISLEEATRLIVQQKKEIKALLGDQEYSP